MKKCPFCAEEIQLEAVLCRFCGRDLTGESPEVVSLKRTTITQELAALEKKLMSWEHYLQEQALLAQQAGRQVNSGWISVIVGLFLIPIFIGIIIAPAGFLTIIRHGAKRNDSEKNQSQAREKIGIIRARIIELKTELSAVQQQ